MQTTLGLAILGLGMALAPLIWVIASSIATRIQAPTGAKSSGYNWSKETLPGARPSIERSETNSTVWITLRLSPDPPLVYTVERASGNSRLHKLTVLYVPWDDALESLTQKSVGSDLNIEGVDDPKWAEYILHQLQEKHEAH